MSCLIVRSGHFSMANSKLFFTRIDTLIGKIDDTGTLKKLKALQEYILNNKTRIVNYAERKKKGLIFTSNMAECAVESLINQRCNGKQHMQWSRSGVQPVLQIRAVIASNDWKSH